MKKNNLLENVLKEILTYSNRYGKDFGLFRLSFDAVMLGNAIQQGYFGMGYNFENMGTPILGGRIGLAIADRVHRYDNYKKGLSPKKDSFVSLVGDDIFRPVVIYSLGYFVGNLFRN
jgi:hypothetical protein